MSCYDRNCPVFKCFVIRTNTRPNKLWFWTAPVLILMNPKTMATCHACNTFVCMLPWLLQFYPTEKHPQCTKSLGSTLVCLHMCQSFWATDCGLSGSSKRSQTCIVMPIMKANWVFGFLKKVSGIEKCYDLHTRQIWNISCLRRERRHPDRGKIPRHTRRVHAWSSTVCCQKSQIIYGRRLQHFKNK